MKFSDTLHILFLHVKENDLQVKENYLRVNFAKAAKYLVYEPVPMCALSIFYEFSVDCFPCKNIFCLKKYILLVCIYTKICK